MINQEMNYSDEGCCGNPEEGASVGRFDPENAHGEEGRLILTLVGVGMSWGKSQKR